MHPSNHAPEQKAVWDRHIPDRIGTYQIDRQAIGALDRPPG